MEYKQHFLEARKEDIALVQPRLFTSDSTAGFMEDFARKYWKRGAELTVQEAKYKETGQPEGGMVKGYSPSGDTALDNLVVTKEVFTAVIRGYDLYMDDSFVRKFTTESDTFYYPKTEYSEIVDEISSSYGSGEQPPHGEKGLGSVSFNLQHERGSTVQWTRSAVESATYDLQGEMLEGLGHNIAVDMMSAVIAQIITSTTGDASSNATIPFANWMPVSALTFTKHASGGVNFTQFLAILAAVDIGFVKQVVVASANASDVAPSEDDIGAVVKDKTQSNAYVGVLVGYMPNTTLVAGTTVMTWIILTKPANAATITAADDLVLVRQDSTSTSAEMKAVNTITSSGLRKYGGPDTVLVSVDVFWDLMAILQFTNTLFTGNTQAISDGVLTTKFGTRIVKESLLPLNTIVALNSSKAIGMCIRRNIKVEPVLFPIWNAYGFLGTVRYDVEVLYPEAMQVAIGA